jgi:hypothetical protein
VPRALIESDYIVSEVNIREGQPGLAPFVWDFDFGAFPALCGSVVAPQAPLDLRMGARYAHHFHALTPRAEVIAVSSPKQEELDWAKENIEGAQTYLDSDELLEEESSLQAVVIASATSVHAEQAIKVIKRGLHVLCEKPLSISVEKV